MFVLRRIRLYTYFTFVVTAALLVRYTTHSRRLEIHQLFNAHQHGTNGKQSEDPERGVIDMVIPWSGEAKGDLSGTNRDDGIIKYQLRSVVKYAPWINIIYIFADPVERPPEWLSEFQGRVILVNRCERFIGGDQNCPTQNTFAVYANLHTIQGLSERYIVCDDDVIFTSFMHIKRFFTDENKIVMGLGSKSRPIYPETSTVGDIKYVTELETELNKGAKYALPTKLPSMSEAYMHAPWPCLKSVVYQMQRDYQEWFEFISSHRVRFCFESDTSAVIEVGNKNGACYKENSYFAIMWYHKVKGRVRPPTQELKMQTVSASFNVINEERLKETINSVPNFLNINDPALIPMKDLALIATDAHTYESYLKRKDYVNRTLNEVFPPR